MYDEGYVKYQCTWINNPPLSVELIEDLNFWRNQLYQLKLIGEDSQGIGYGNLSKRWQTSNQFIVSGTQTGGFPILTEKHYTLVTDYNIQDNCLTCTGPIKASSEALTHASLYQTNSSINGVIHVHNQQLWENLQNQVPTTSPYCAYGTPEMAVEIARLAQLYPDEKIIVMSGHFGGIITFGTDLNQAGKIILSLVN